VVELNSTQYDPGGSAWFAVQSLSRHEMVRGQLQKRNVEHFLPTIQRLNQWTDRKKKVEVPLFAGYCFARLASEDRLAVLQSQGVVRLVGCMGRREPIPDHEIDSLRTLSASYSSKLVSHPYFEEGMLVEVTKGYQGTVDSRGKIRSIRSEH
jgi:transcription termination/antitermination protein NusG